MDAIAKVAFFRTYACRCVRHWRTGSASVRESFEGGFHATYVVVALRALHPEVWCCLAVSDAQVMVLGGVVHEAQCVSPNIFVGRL